MNGNARPFVDKQVPMTWRFRSVVRDCPIQVLLFGALLVVWFGFVHKGGLGHTYYSASARTLASNPKWLLSGAFDSGGYVTVDKPSLGLLPTALGVRLFGANSVGFILPNAI